MASEGEPGENLAAMEEEVEMLLAGYRACVEETFRFLLVDEQLPPNSPLLAGLWRHLLQQELRLAEQLDIGEDSGVSTGSSTSSSISNFPAEDEEEDHSSSSVFSEPNGSDILTLGPSMSSPISFLSKQENTMNSYISGTNQATHLTHSSELRSESHV